MGLLVAVTTIALATVATSCGEPSVPLAPLPPDATSRAASVPSEKPPTPVDEPQATAVPGTPSPTAAATPAIAPTATPAALPTPTPLPPATPVPVAPRPETADEPPERDLLELAQRLGRRGDALPRPVHSTSTQEGDKQEFFVTDLLEDSVHTVTATLAVISDHALWYLDDTLAVSREGLARSAKVYENDIRPVMVAGFGDIRTPGIDNDPRLTVLTTKLNGAAGYFGSQDEYSRQVHPKSNERQMVYMDGSVFPPGSTQYLSALGHELQHAVHANADRGEDAWINEGMSEVAKSLAGYDFDFVEAFLTRPETQLNYWPDGLRNTPAHYGAATLFVAYLAEHYGGTQGLRELVFDPLDSVAGVEAYLARAGTSFEEVFADWVVANYLSAQTGRYGYGGASHRVRKIDLMSGFGSRSRQQPQLSARYVVARLDGNGATIGFEGNTEVARFASRCHSGSRCWWGNRGDSIDSMLTREFDLTGLQTATLGFRTWFEIEEGWDYAYVQVSADDGETWTLVRGKFTTDDDPIGNSYGHGFTGSSEGWVRDEVDLTPYVGGRVLVRFEYVTDEGVYLDGFVIDDVEIPELGFADDAEDDAGWDARGFLRTDNILRQRYIVQVIERAAGKENVVRRLELDASNRGKLVVDGDVTNAVIIVSPFTPDTARPASYTLTVAPVSEHP